ncbi:MAG: GTPase [Candidatus Micrarchaeota archaeon]
MKGQSFNLRTYNSVKMHLQKCAWAIEVVDARNVERTRIPPLETKFLDKLFIAATKSDLLKELPNQGQMNSKTKKTPIFYVSSKTKEGIPRLKSELKKVISRKLLSKEPPIDIFIFGIPNVGKSSLLNSITGKKIAKTGFRSGITRGIQWINFDSNSRLVDAPGVAGGGISADSLAAYAAIDAQNITDPFGAAKKILFTISKKNPGEIEKHYSISPSSHDPQDILDAIAHRRKMLLKGGEPDTNAAARLLIFDFQKGKISA